MAAQFDIEGQHETNQNLIKKLESKNEKLGKDLDDKTKQIDSLQKDLNGKYKQIQQLQIDLKNKDSDINQKIDEVKHKDEKIKTLQHDKNEQKENLQRKNREIDQLQNEKQRNWWISFGIGAGIVIGTAVAGYYLYQYSQSSLFKENIQLKSNNNSQEISIKTLKDKLQFYESNDLKDRDGTIGALQNLNERLKTQLKAANQRNSDETIRYQSLEFKYDALEEKYGLMNKEDWESKLEETVKVKDKLKLQNQELNKNLNQKNEQISGFQKLLPSWWGLIGSFIFNGCCAIVAAGCFAKLQEDPTKNELEENVRLLGGFLLCLSLYGLRNGLLYWKYINKDASK